MCRPYPPLDDLISTASRSEYERLLNDQMVNGKSCTYHQCQLGAKLLLGCSQHGQGSGCGYLEEFVVFPTEENQQLQLVVAILQVAFLDLNTGKMFSIFRLFDKIAAAAIFLCLFVLICDVRSSCRIPSFSPCPSTPHQPHFRL